MELQELIERINQWKQRGEGPPETAAPAGPRVPPPVASVTANADDVALEEIEDFPAEEPDSPEMLSETGDAADSAEPTMDISTEAMVMAPVIEEETTEDIDVSQMEAADMAVETTGEIDELDVVSEEPA